MQRVSNRIHKARKHIVKSRRDIRKLGGPEKARLLREIELYDDYGNRVTNIETLRAIAESDMLVAEWKDHPLKGAGRNLRECHAKGDLLLVYRIDGGDDKSVITFLRAGTHSEIFGS